MAGPTHVERRFFGLKVRVRLSLPPLEDVLAFVRRQSVLAPSHVDNLSANHASSSLKLTRRQVLRSGLIRL